jgi:hypothetical protein
MCALRPSVIVPIMNIRTPSISGVILITLGVVVAGGALLFYNRSTPNYRDCVALMWDRKHPEAVKQRKEEAELHECEADRLRGGFNCDCNARKGQPGSCPKKRRRQRVFWSICL